MPERRSAVDVFGGYPDPPLRARDVSLIYESLLGRAASKEEAAAQQGAAGDWRTLIAAVASSDEFHSRLRAGTVASAPPRANIWHPDLADFGHRSGEISADGEVVVGEQGWLFLVGGTNSVFAQYDPSFRLSDDWAPLWADALAVRREGAAALGSRLALIVVPDKLSVLPHLAPASHRPSAESPAARLVDGGVLFPRDELRDLPDDAYLRTDSHLTTAGSMELAKLVLASVGEELTIPAPGPPARYPTSGDLGRRLEPAAVEVITVAGSLGAARVAFDNGPELRAVGRHVGTRTVLVNPLAEDRRTVVVFGDSYALASAGYQGLGWFLAQQFAEVHILWAPFGWDPGYAKSVGAQIVICEMAERFAHRPPSSQVDIEALAAAAARAS